MRFDLSRFKSGTDRIDRTYEPSAFGTEDAGDFRVVGQARLVADAVKDGAKVQLTGRLTATLELACSRCLEPYELRVDASLDLTYVPEPVEAAAAKAAAPPAKAGRARREDADEDEGVDAGEADDLGVSFYTGDAIDLGQLMREQFFLALPMKPLCKDDCRGLCPVCGTNRNRETCSCESTWVDPRFEVLKQFRKNGN